jgi:AbrB family looped-hinge helix DNA binding protein
MQMRSHESAGQRATTKISSKGQIVIPREVRDALRWRQGDTLVVETKGHELVLRRQSSLGPSLTVEEVAGMGKKLYQGSPLSLDELDRKAREHFAREWKKQRKIEK